MLDGYGPYISAQVDVFVYEESPLIDVDGLMSDIRSTDDGDDGVRIMFETGAIVGYYGERCTMVSLSVNYE
jgi:hypothetical protein